MRREIKLRAERRGKELGLNDDDFLIEHEGVGMS